MILKDLTLLVFLKNFIMIILNKWKRITLFSPIFPVFKKNQRRELLLEKMEFTFKPQIQRLAKRTSISKFFRKNSMSPVLSRNGFTIFVKSWGYRKKKRLFLPG